MESNYGRGRWCRVWCGGVTGSAGADVNDDGASGVGIPHFLLYRQQLIPQTDFPALSPWL